MKYQRHERLHKKEGNFLLSVLLWVLLAFLAVGSIGVITWGIQRLALYSTDHALVGAAK